MATLHCTGNDTSHMFTAGKEYTATPAGFEGRHWDVIDDNGHARFILGDDLRFITGRTPFVQLLVGDNLLFAYFEVVEK